jgi:uncharacterized protein YbjT (DUF2867 family)
MTHPTILVTGATGKTGSAVVAQLREKGVPVKAVVRTRDARSARLERLGAEIAVADLFDAEQLAAAMKGTHRAYYCPPFHTQMIHSAVAFTVAAREAKLESVVGLSQWLASASHPSLSTRQHWLADRLLADLPGIGHTIVNPGLFAEYPYLALMGYASQLGLFPMPGDGTSRNAPPSNEDIARVAVAALVDPNTHDGKTYRPTGPTLISIKDMASILTKVLGRTVRHVPIPMWMFFKAARMDGTSPILLHGLRYYVQEQIRGTFEFGAPTNHVLEVTGRQPEDFETIARRYATRPEVQRTLGNRLRAFLAFMSVPMRPGFNSDRFAAEQTLPMPSKPLLDLDNPRWKLEHSVPSSVAANVRPLRAGVGA